MSKKSQSTASPTKKSSARATAPRVVMLVDNRVVGDSRVIKSARTASAAGYDVTILGMGPREELIVGGVPVILCPPVVGGSAGRHVTQRLAARLSARNVAAAERSLAQRAGRSERRVARAERIGAGANPAAAAAIRAVVSGLRAGAAVDQGLNGVRLKAAAYAAGPPRDWRQVAAKVTGRPAPTGSDPDAWAHLDPIPQRLSDGWQDEIARIRPHLIHAHDYRTLPAAIEARGRAAAHGHVISVVYDAHEWVPGYDELGPRRHEAAMRIERSLIRVANAVVTVAPAIGALIRAEYELPDNPTIVLNAPEQSPGPTPGPTLRERVRVPDGAPLLVYAGSVGLGRSLRMCVQALAQLPGVHLAFVVGLPDSAVMLELADLASELGVRDRFHVTRYVPQEYIVDFMRGADIGLTPMRHGPNTENSMPTKAREYLLAGVPQVVSDVRTLSRFIAENGFGEVYVADDVTSFADAVRRVLADPDRYRRPLNAAQLRANAWPGQGEKLMKVYAGLLGKRKLRPVPGQGGNERAERAEGADGRRATTTPRPVLLPAPTQATELVIGPSNSAGQGAAWAAAARTLPDVGAVNVSLVHDSAFRFPADLAITTAERTDPAWVDAFEGEVCATRTHVLLESGSTLAGTGIDAVSLLTEVDRFERAGLTVGVVLHGSEVRSPDRHRELHHRSPFHDGDPDFVATLQQRSNTTGRVVEWLGLPTFVSTLDLLDHVPWATWLPVSIDTARFEGAPPALERQVPVVVHAPSNAALKGSAAIDPVLTELDSAGVIVYRRVVDADRDEVVEAIRSADVVVDQLGIGLYGVLAVEAMAAGRLVLAEVGDAIRARVPGGPPPIVEIDATTLADVVRDVARGDRTAYAELAAAGPQFVRTHHDGRAAAAVLAGFLAPTTLEDPPA